MPCKRLKELNSWEVTQLINHIRDNQYYMGEEAHHSIEWNEAELDFVLNYLGEVGKELRLEFCTHLCPLSSDCDLIAKFIERDET